MTTGEKINYYRKQLGLSQEELGQKLLVSRQTVSLWEKGQTVPTIDNLIRLKEIFGVSVDEILGVEEEKENDDADLPASKESYKFNYSKEEINQIFRQSNKSMTIRILLLAFIAAMSVLATIYYEESSGVSGFSAGFLIATIAIWFTTLFINSKNSKKSKEGVVKSFYDFNVFDNYFTVTVSRNGERKADYKLYFDEIEKFVDVGAFLLLVINGQSFILRKESLAPNSIFTLLAKSNPEKTVVNKKGLTTQALLNLLFVVTLFSLLIPMPIISLVSSTDTLMFNYLWIFYLVTPIPVVSIIVGLIYKRKGYKCKKNIVSGIIILILLCIYGSIGFGIEDEADHTDAAIVKAEEIIGIDIPEAAYIDTYYWKDDEQSFSRGLIYSSSDISFDEGQANAFEKEISENPYWLTKLPSDLYGLTSSISEYYEGTYILLYNADTKEFNTVPKENGTYHFFSVGYDAEFNSMQIYEYDIEYIK